MLGPRQGPLCTKPGNRVEVTQQHGDPPEPNSTASCARIVVVVPLVRRHRDDLDVLRVQGLAQGAARLRLLGCPQIAHSGQDGRRQPVSVAAASVQPSRIGSPLRATGTSLSKACA